MKKKWTRLIAFFLSVMMVMTCLPLSAFAADGGAESAGTQTNLTPNAIADDGKMSAPAQPTVYAYQLDTDGLDSGEYGITAPGNNRTVGMHDSGAYTNQCPVTITGEVMTLPHIEHNWTVVWQPNGKYTIQGNGGKYLTSTDCTNPSNQLVLGTEAEEFTVTHVSGGSYTVQNAAGKYLTYTESGSKRWGMADSAFNIQFYKKTEVAPSLAQTEFKGTTNRPMNPDAPGSYFRIPSLVTLSNGWIMATSDIRWYSTNDSPNNLDTIVSISKDGGTTWDYEVINYFADYAPTKQLAKPYGVAKGASASFIDPAVVQAGDGTIYLLVDVQPPYINGGKIGNGFDSKGRLEVGYIPVANGYTMDNAHDNNLHGYTYDYYVDINNASAGTERTVNMTDLGGAAAETVKLWPICAQSGNTQTGYYADAFFNTYYDYGENNGGFKPVIAQQHDSTDFIHNNLFYTQSDWKAFPTAFIMVRSATVNETTGKLDWSAPKLLNGQIKHDDEHFIGVCPGRGVVTTVNGKERIIFPLYDNQTGNELASTIYSDDHGQTWTRGERTPDVSTNNTGKTSESQIVVLPVSDDPADGTFLRMYSRNGRPTINYANSYDGGQTWGTSLLDNNLNADNQNGQGCMVSFINVAGYLAGPDGKVYENLIMASYPQGTHAGVDKKRTDGTIRIGSYNTKTGLVDWLNEETIRYSGSYIYSCLTQKLDANKKPTANFALLYETDDSPTTNAEGNHFTDILYTTFTMTDLLGTGWEWMLTLDGYEPVGGNAYTPAKAEQDGKTVKYLSFTGGDSSSRWWDVSGAAGDTAKIQLYRAASATIGSAVTLDTDGIEAGGYVINFDTGNSSRQAVMHYSSNASDGWTDQGTTLAVAHDANDTALLHLFDFAAAEGNVYSNAFTIKAHSVDKYLSLDAASNGQRAFKDEKTTFYVTQTGTAGSYYIWITEDPVDYSTWEKAETSKKGTTSGEPFSTDDVGTQMFRIPAIITLSNGWLVAAADVRWASYLDNPANLDTIVSVSKDNGKTWEWEVVNYFGDYANDITNNLSAAFIDPALVQDPDTGKVWMAIDVTAANGKATSGSTGYDSQNRILVAHVPAYVGQKAPGDTNLYTYYVSKVGTSYVVDGKDVTLYPIESYNGATDSNGVYVDAFMNLYRVTDGAVKREWCKQEGAEKAVQANLFYKQSEWKVFPTCFIMLRSATVTESGLVWDDPIFPNVRYANQTQPFFGVCPGRGFVTENGRIIFPVYDNATGEKASTIYSDDNGVTWQRGSRSVISHGGKTSESQIISLPDGTLRMYSRNAGGTRNASYADSTDGGVTWSATKADTGLQHGSNCMYSIINVAGILKDPDGKSYENVVMVSYPEGNGGASDWGNRSNGSLRIGYISGSTSEGWTINWLGEPKLYHGTAGTYFAYSCLTQFHDPDSNKPTDKFCALYEPNDNSAQRPNLPVDIWYKEFDVAFVLGEGWTLHEHTEDNGTVTTEATCTEAGEKTISCSICGETLRVEVIPAAGHTEQAVESSAPTCTENGLTAGTICSVCGETLTGREGIPATGHTVVIDPAVPATETSTGLTQGSHCGVCDEVLVAQRVVPALGPAPTQTPTPTTPGTWTPSEPSTPDTSTSTTTTTNPDGSTTTTVTDNKTGAVTETTRKEDGTVEVVETRKDGTVTETTTDPEGGKVEKVTDPNKDVTITATNPEGEVLAKVEIPAEIPVLDADKHFTDVPDNHYAADAINNMAALGVVNGVGNQQFNRDGEMKRGDLAVILYRMSNGSDSYELKFDDIPKNRYYANGVAWAAETGVVTGYSENTFGPEDTITREQLALMLYRYAALLGLDTTASADALSAFTDGANTHSWAADGMAWCVENGILQGRGNGVLDPGTNVIRADVAVMLQRFMNLLK